MQSSCPIRILPSLLIFHWIWFNGVSLGCCEIPLDNSWDIFRTNLPLKEFVLLWSDFQKDDSPFDSAVINICSKSWIMFCDFLAGYLGCKSTAEFWVKRPNCQDFMIFAMFDTSLMAKSQLYRRTEWWIDSKNSRLVMIPFSQNGATRLKRRTAEWGGLQWRTNQVLLRVRIDHKTRRTGLRRKVIETGTSGGSGRVPHPGTDV
jgi:hypothetical protein